MTFAIEVLKSEVQRLDSELADKGNELSRANKSCSDIEAKIVELERTRAGILESIAELGVDLGATGPGLSPQAGTMHDQMAGYRGVLG
jgi:chromosome segregation ATPase